jgi:hypothetical protein
MLLVLGFEAPHDSPYHHIIRPCYSTLGRQVRLLPLANYFFPPDPLPDV